MALDPAIYFSTIAEISAHLRARDFSAEDLTRGFLDRLESVGRRLNAVALVLREEAIREAKRADDEIKRGRFRGPLHGIPFGVKDLLSVAGSPTTWGARPYAGQVFDYTSTVVSKLQGTRAVLTSKLAMVELAGGGGYRTAAASLQGPGLNPWDTSRWSGGSSSGPGAAVAAGVLPFAIGSETSGSILTPSAYCGVTGLRPTYGMVSRYGAMALSWTMDKIGPMCRSAEDCGVVLQAIAGGDAKDPGSAGKGFNYAPQYVRKFADLKIGYNPADFDGPVDPAARPAFQAALEVFRGFGSRMVEISLPDLPYGAMTSTIISAEGSAAFEPLIRSGGVDNLADAHQIAGLKAGLETPAVDYLRAQRIRLLVQQAFRKLFVDVDVLLTPTRPGPATLISEPIGGGRAGQNPEPTERGLRDLIPAGNLAGIPALSLPCGFAGNLPVAVCLVSRPFTENTLLAYGREFQTRTDWHRRRPQI